MAKTFKLEVLLILLLGAYISSSSGGCKRSPPSSHTPDIAKKSALTKLFYQRVVHAVGVRRSLFKNGTWMLGPLSHSGVLVTLADGSKWLVHKIKGSQCRGGNTVVTSARHMSKRWRSIPGTSRDVHKSRLRDFVKAGGTGYFLIGDNCHDARCSMSHLP